MFEIGDGINAKSTRAFVAAHAESTPSGIAVIDHGREVTFAEFDRELSRYNLMAQGYGLPHGGTVAVEWVNLYEHWLWLLTFEELGVMSCSYAAAEVAAYAPLLAAADLVISTKAGRPQSCKQWRELTGTARDEGPDRTGGGEEVHVPLDTTMPWRMHYGSGTTGHPKCMVKTRGNHEYRVWQFFQKGGFDRTSRFLVTQSFCMQGIYIYATACLRAGGACVYEPLRPIIQTLSSHGITHAHFLPVVLEKTVAALPPDHTAPANLAVSVFGGRVSARLRERVREVLNAEIAESYSTNETGSICTVRPDGTGTVLPGVCVEVVDDNGVPVVGQPGHIRVKSPSCIDGYHGDGADNEQRFRDGWFYPGDIAVMLPSGDLRLFGRVDDLIELGGVKIDPSVLEAPLRQFLAPRDLCVTWLTDRAGNYRLCLALVLDASVSYAEVQNKLAPKLKELTGDWLVIRVDQIPRTANGKAQRRELQKKLSGLLSRNSGNS